jgi:hypothetical protein
MSYIVFTVNATTTGGGGGGVSFIAASNGVTAVPSLITDTGILFLSETEDGRILANLENYLTYPAPHTLSETFDATVTDEAGAILYRGPAQWVGLNAGNAGDALRSQNGTPVWVNDSGVGTVTQIDAGSGIEGGPITVSGSLSLSEIPANTVLANSSIASSQTPTGVPFDVLLDNSLEAPQGSLVYRALSEWVEVPPGSDTQFLRGGLNPSWGDIDGNPGTVTQINTSNGVKGGPITSMGSLTLEEIPEATVLSNAGALPEYPTGNDLKVIMDDALGASAGAVAVRGSSTWGAVSPGVASDVFTMGATFPSWSGFVPGPNFFYENAYFMSAVGSGSNDGKSLNTPKSLLTGASGIIANITNPSANNIVYVLDGGILSYGSAVVIPTGMNLTILANFSDFSGFTNDIFQVQPGARLNVVCKDITTGSAYYVVRTLGNGASFSLTCDNIPVGKVQNIYDTACYLNVKNASGNAVEAQGTGGISGFIGSFDPSTIFGKFTNQIGVPSVSTQRLFSASQVINYQPTYVNDLIVTTSSSTGNYSFVFSVDEVSATQDGSSFYVFQDGNDRIAFSANAGVTLISDKDSLVTQSRITKGRGSMIRVEKSNGNLISISGELVIS